MNLLEAQRLVEGIRPSEMLHPKKQLQVDRIRHNVHLLLVGVLVPVEATRRVVVQLQVEVIHLKKRVQAGVTRRVEVVPQVGVIRPIEVLLQAEVARQAEVRVDEDDKLNT